MTTEQITQIIHESIPKEHIHKLDITICPWNKQIENILIVFKEEIGDIPLHEIGVILEKLDLLTQEDEYGDITEILFNLTRYYTLPDEGLNTEGLTTAIYFDINIDS